MSGVNDGHIIIKERSSIERGIRDATVAVLEHDRNAQKHRAMPTMTEDGLYALPEQLREQKIILKPLQIRELASAYAIRGVAVSVDITDTEAVVTFSRRPLPGAKPKQSVCRFSAQHPPNLLQARRLLDAAAAKARC